MKPTIATAITPSATPTPMPAVAPVERPEEEAGVGDADDVTGGVVVVVLGDGVETVDTPDSPATLVSRTVIVYP